MSAGGGQAKLIDRTMVNDCRGLKGQLEMELYDFVMWSRMDSGQFIYQDIYGPNNQAASSINMRYDFVESCLLAVVKLDHN